MMSLGNTCKVTESRRAFPEEVIFPVLKTKDCVDMVLSKKGRDLAFTQFRME